MAEAWSGRPLLMMTGPAISIVTKLAWRGSDRRASSSAKIACIANDAPRPCGCGQDSAAQPPA